MAVDCKQNQDTTKPKMVPTCYRIPETVRDRLNDYVEQNGMRHQFVVAQALTEYLDRKGAA